MRTYETFNYVANKIISSLTTAKSLEQASKYCTNECQVFFEDIENNSIGDYSVVHEYIDGEHNNSMYFIYSHDMVKIQIWDI